MRRGRRFDSRQILVILIVCIIEMAGVTAIVAVSYFVPMIQSRNEILFFRGGIVIRNKKSRQIKDVLMEEKNYAYDVRDIPMRIYGFIPYPTVKISYLRVRVEYSASRLLSLTSMTRVSARSW